MNRPVPAPAPEPVGRPVVTGVRTRVPVPIPVNKGVAKMLGPNVGLNVGTLARHKSAKRCLQSCRHECWRSCCCADSGWKGGVECGKPRARTRRCLSWSHQLKCVDRRPAKCQEVGPRACSRLCGHWWEGGVESGKHCRKNPLSLHPCPNPSVPELEHQLKCRMQGPCECRDMCLRARPRPCGHGWECGMECGKPCRKNPRPRTRTRSGTSCNRRNIRRGNGDHTCPCPGREGRAIAVAGKTPSRANTHPCGPQGHYRCSCPGRCGTPNLRRRHHAGGRCRGGHDGDMTSTKVGVGTTVTVRVGKAVT